MWRLTLVGGGVTIREPHADRSIVASVSMGKIPTDVVNQRAKQTGMYLSTASKFPIHLTLNRSPTVIDDCDTLVMAATLENEKKVLFTVYDGCVFLLFAHTDYWGGYILNSSRSASATLTYLLKKRMLIYDDYWAGCEALLDNKIDYETEINIKNSSDFVSPLVLLKDDFLI